MKITKDGFEAVITIPSTEAQRVTQTYIRQGVRLAGILALCNAFPGLSLEDAFEIYATIQSELSGGLRRYLPEAS